MTNDQILEAYETRAGEVNGRGQILEVQGNTVYGVVFVRRTKTSPQHKIIVGVDFSNLTQEQLLKLAYASRVITLQDKLRENSEEFLSRQKVVRIDAAAMTVELDPALAKEKKLEAMRKAMREAGISEEIIAQTVLTVQ